MFDFDYITTTPISIDGKPHTVKFENGMTGIGSRDFWLDGKNFGMFNAVIQSDDLTEGNHFLYLMKWRDTPWDKVYIFISEKYLPLLLEEKESWREIQKINL
jgi:hypothetical protein